MRHRSHRRDGAEDDRVVLVDEVVFDPSRETSAVVPTFRNVRDFTEVGVADDGRAAAGIFCGSGVRARRACFTIGRLQRRLEPDLLLEEVGPLAQLVADVSAAVLAADFPGRR